MKAVILAAGIAKRLQVVLQEKHPKCLLKIGDKTIMARQIEALLKAGVNETLVVVGYMAESIMEYLTITFPQMRFQFVYNPYFESTNTIYSMYLALPFLKESFIQLNGDVVLEEKMISSMFKQYEMVSQKSFLAVDKSSVNDEAVKVSLKDGLVSGIGKHIPNHEAKGEAVGINIIGNDILEDYKRHIFYAVEKADNKNDYYEYAIDLITKEKPLLLFDTTSYKVIEIDYEEDLAKAKSMFV